MATLKEIYNELEMIMEDVEAYVEEADNANLASDVAGSVKNPLEKILSALDGIMDDESAGVYEDYGEDEFYEEDEDLW
jgi:hypothetical protein